MRENVDVIRLVFSNHLTRETTGCEDTFCPVQTYGPTVQTYGPTADFTVW